MDHLPNIFKNFDNLYEVNVADIQSRLGVSLPPIVIENYVANRLLFPYAIPSTKQESQLELAILGAVVSHNSGFFYNQALQKITIPPEYNLVYQNINQLVEVVISNVGLVSQATIVIPNLTGHNTTGSAIAIPASPKPITVVYDNLKAEFVTGNFLHLPPKPTNSITIDNTSYTLTPGELGVYIFSNK